MSVDKFGSSGGKLSSMASGDREYVDQKFATLSTNLATKINKSGDTMKGNFNILCDKDNLRTFGVSDINAGKSVSLLLGDVDNQIRHDFGDLIKIVASYGMKVTCPAGDICKLGSHTDTKSSFHGDIIMNNKCISELHEPNTPQDAATMNYVDTRYVKNNTAFIPHLHQNVNNKSGFEASASSELSPRHQARLVFCESTTTERGWQPFAISTANPECWIQIKCPDKVKVHKFKIRGLRENYDVFKHIFRFQGSNDGVYWFELYRATDVLITRDLVSFNVHTPSSYFYYRLFFETAIIGLSYWQLYTLDPIA